MRYGVHIGFCSKVFAHDAFLLAEYAVILSVDYIILPEVNTKCGIRARGRGGFREPLWAPPTPARFSKKRSTLPETCIFLLSRRAFFAIILYRCFVPFWRSALWAGAGPPAAPPGHLPAGFYKAFADPTRSICPAGHCRYWA